MAINICTHCRHQVPAILVKQEAVTSRLGQVPWSSKIRQLVAKCLSSPVTIVVGQLTLAQYGMTTESSSKDSVDKLSDACKAMTELVEE
jgi:hypothetical protein